MTWQTLATRLSWLDLEEAVRLAARGDIVEAASVAALFRATYGLVRCRDPRP